MPPILDLCKRAYSQCRPYAPRFLAYFGLMVLWYIFYIICALLVAGATTVAGVRQIESTAGSIMTGGFSLLGILLFVVYLAGLQLFAFANIRSASHLSNSQEKETIKQECSFIFSKLLPIIGASILVNLLFGLGMLFLIIPGIYLAPRLTFFSPPLALGTHNAMDSIRYSWNITRGKWWATAARLYLPSFMLYLGLSIVCVSLLGITFYLENNYIQSIVGILAVGVLFIGSVGVSLFRQLAFTTLFFDLTRTYQPLPAPTTPAQSQQTL